MKKISYATQLIDLSDMRAVNKALKSEFLTQGPMVDKFEKTISNYCGAKYAVAVNSGTSALHIACLAAGLKKGDEAITSPITFVASANCILYCGAKPIFADIDDNTICIHSKEIANKISSRTKVIIPVDFAGYPADLSAIRSIAKQKGLLIIEDASHALGAEFCGSKIGCGKYSDMSILSFHAVKHITTGEGGVVLTNDKKFYEKLLMLRTHGITRKIKYLTKNEGAWYYEMHHLGHNYRLTGFQCALGLSQLKKLSCFLRIRREIVAQYNSAFTNFDCLKLLEEKENVKSAHHLYIIKFDKKKISTKKRDIFDAYYKKGIMVNMHYIPVYLQPYYRRLGYKKGLCPNAESYYKEAITLPLHPKMTNRDVRRVIRVRRKLLKSF